VADEIVTSDFFGERLLDTFQLVTEDVTTGTMAAAASTSAVRVVFLPRSSSIARSFALRLLFAATFSAFSLPFLSWRRHDPKSDN
jgi:hypothetical protein